MSRRAPEPVELAELRGWLRAAKGRLTFESLARRAGARKMPVSACTLRGALDGRLPILRTVQAFARGAGADEEEVARVWAAAAAAARPAPVRKPAAYVPGRGITIRAGLATAMEKVRAADGGPSLRRLAASPQRAAPARRPPVRYSPHARGSWPGLCPGRGVGPPNRPSTGVCVTRPCPSGSRTGTNSSKASIPVFRCVGGRHSYGERQNAIGGDGGSDGGRGRSGLARPAVARRGRSRAPADGSLGRPHRRRAEGAAAGTGRGRRRAAQPSRRTRRVHPGGGRSRRSARGPGGGGPRRAVAASARWRGDVGVRGLRRRGRRRRRTCRRPSRSPAR